jgi:hypothetical protein
MSPRSRGVLPHVLRRALLRCAVLSVAGLPLQAQTAATTPPPPRHPCPTDPEARRFDFWVGTWDVTVRGQPAGTNDVQLLLHECLLLENWTAARGGTGKSVNFWDRGRRVWRQVWVADNGQALDYTGAFRDGAMRFEGETVGPDGARTLQKLTFFPIAADTVRQLFESSRDGGRTWTPGFDGLYVRKPGTPRRPPPP